MFARIRSSCVAILKKLNCPQIQKYRPTLSSVVYLTMLGCSSSFSNDISLMAVEGTPSHSLSVTQVV